VIGRAQWAAGAWRGASGDSAGALRRTRDLRTDQRTTDKTSVQIFRQRQHGGRRQEFRDIGERASSHEWVCHLARLGRPASNVAATAAKPIACAKPMVLVLFHRAAGLASDP